MFQSLKQRVGLDPQNLTYSLAENVVVYNALFCIWLPLNGTVAKLYCDWSAREADTASQTAAE